MNEAVFDDLVKSVEAMDATAAGKKNRTGSSNEEKGTEGL